MVPVREKPHRTSVLVAERLCAKEGQNMAVNPKPGLNRLLRADGRAVMVAMDHARLGGVVARLEDPANAIEAVIAGGADAIMTSYGVIKHFDHRMQGRVGRILRLDTGPSKYREGWDEYTEWFRPYSVEDGLRLGVDGVIVNGFLGLAVDATTLRIMGETASAADKWGIPFMAEVHPCPCPRIQDPFAPEQVADAARIGAEFGADLIKTYYTGDADGFRVVTSSCPIPVLIAGGPKTESTADLFEMVHGMISGGGKGTVIGRNIWQGDDVVAVTRGIVSIVHGGASVEQALSVYDCVREATAASV